MKDLNQGVDLEFTQNFGKLIVEFGKIYNGFEAYGIEKIPLDKPALLVFYHGLIPVDAWYFGLHFYLQKKVLIRALGDRWLFRTPGLNWICRAVGAVPGDPKVALELLKNGNLVGVSPGGVREAIKGMSNNYKLVWGNREGFAKLAIEAKVDIIPVFTENIEETYVAPYAEKPIFQMLYEMTKLPLVPILGMGVLPFPVKLRTWVGDPITFDPSRSPKELKELTANALNELIEKHQNKKQNVIDAVRSRLL